MGSDPVPERWKSVRDVEEENMKKILLIGLSAFVGTLVLMELIDRLLDADMPEWMKEQVNR